MAFAAVHQVHSVHFHHQRSFPATTTTDLGFSEEELQVPAAQDAVVLDIAGQVHSAGAVHGAVDLHVAVDGVQVLLFVLQQTGRHACFVTHD